MELKPISKVLPVLGIFSKPRSTVTWFNDCQSITPIVTPDGMFDLELILPVDFEAFQPRQSMVSKYAQKIVNPNFYEVVTINETEP